MLFNSWEFLILLAVTWLLYFAGAYWCGRHAKAWQVILLLAASTVFYGWEDPRLLALLAVSCAGNSVASARIILHKVRGDEARARRWVKLAVVLNLSLLAMFKYAGFVAAWIPGLPQGAVDSLKSIPLPIGISFYTFHGISMIVDIWRGEVTREGDEMLSHGARFAKGVRDIGFYLLFFPQLVAGPIVKAKQFWPQIGAKRLCDVRWPLVVRCLIAGYFLKMVVADNLAEQTVVLTKPWITDMAPLDLVCLLYGYSFQIFADFGGYSLIAIGLAAMFGYRFPDNFNFPYLSTSVTEFWRRWHMSLSSWLRDYLYIPLGGNRKGEGRTYVNLFLVMFLGGLWHGAEWKFALWGTMHGVFLALERFWARRRGKLDAQAAVGGALVLAGRFPTPEPRSLRSVLRSVAGWFYTFHAVTLLWLTFLMPDLRQIGIFFWKLTDWQSPHGPPVFVPVVFGSAVVLYHLAAWFKEHQGALFERFRGSWSEGACYGVMLYLIATNWGPPQGFIYFQF